jgi:hypothetical protein
MGDTQRGRGAAVGGQVHFRKFYGRPRAQVTQLQELAARGRSKSQRRADLAREGALAALAALTEGQRELLTRYHESELDDHVCAGMALALEWLLGEGLNPAILRRVLSEYWGDEVVAPFRGE